MFGCGRPAQDVSSRKDEGIRASYKHKTYDDGEARDLAECQWVFAHIRAHRRVDVRCLEEAPSARLCGGRERQRQLRK